MRHDGTPLLAVRAGAPMTGGSDQVGDLVGDRPLKEIEFVTASDIEVVAQCRAFAAAPACLSGGLSTQVKTDDRIGHGHPVGGT